MKNGYLPTDSFLREMVPLDELLRSAVPVFPERMISADDVADAMTLSADMFLSETSALELAVILAFCTSICPTPTSDDEVAVALNESVFSDLIFTTDDDEASTDMLAASMLSAQIPDDDDVSILTVRSGTDRSPFIDIVDADVNSYDVMTGPVTVIETLFLRYSRLLVR